MEIKKCAHCSKELTNRRRKFCNDSCKYWYNSIKKDNESHLPPVKKRNRNYFRMVTGSEWAKSGSRQGKRAGHMVMGSMAAMVRQTTEEIVEVNKENLQQHFKGIPGYMPVGIRTGSGEFFKKDEIEKEYGITID
jgi:hypothetical protein